MSADDTLYKKSRTVDQNGRANIPVEMRMALDIDDGETEIEYELKKDGTILLKNPEQADPAHK